MKNPVITAYLEHDETAISDPYSAAVSVVVAALEFADAHSGAMSQAEYDTIQALAATLRERDPEVKLFPAQVAAV